jgi:hypothetical protein
MSLYYCLHINYYILFSSFTYYYIIVNSHYTLLLLALLLHIIITHLLSPTYIHYRHIHIFIIITISHTYYYTDMFHLHIRLFLHLHITYLLHIISFSSLPYLIPLSLLPSYMNYFLFLPFSFFPLLHTYFFSMSSLITQHHTHNIAFHTLHIILLPYTIISHYYTYSYIVITTLSFITINII